MVRPDLMHERRELWLATDVLKRDERVDQPPIEEDPFSRLPRLPWLTQPNPASLLFQREQVGARHGDHAAQKGRHVDLWQRIAMAGRFFHDDAPPWFFHHGIATRPEFAQQRRFPAPRTP